MDNLEALEEKVEDRKRLRKLASYQARLSAREDIRRASVVLGLITGFVVALIGGFFAWLAVRHQDDFIPMAPRAPVMQVSTMVKLSNRLAKDYYRASTLEERLAFVSRPGETEAKMRAYYEREKLLAEEVVGIIDPMDHTAQERQFLMATIVFKNRPDRFCVFEQIDGQMKIDWEVLENYSDMGWEEFLQAQPTEPIQFRVRLNTASYYNYSFSDRDRYIAFKLRHPVHEHELFGYLDKESESFRRFVRVRLMSTLRDLPVLVQLRFPEGAEDPNQVEISAIDSFSWVSGIEM